MKITPLVKLDERFTESEKSLIVIMTVFFLECYGGKNDFFKVDMNANELHDAKNILEKCGGI